jgi:hypothetical protein
MNLDFLESINAESIWEVKFPLLDALENSLYYPCSGVDGTPIRHWVLGVNSFVYADFSLTLSQYLQALVQQPVHGYRVVAQRNVIIEEIAPRGWSKGAPPEVDLGEYDEVVRHATRVDKELFALWSVFERLPSKGDAYGPRRFSLLHLRAEGVATYAALYSTNSIRPKILCFIRPGLAFGGNYHSYVPALVTVLQSNAAGIPEELLWEHHGQESRQPDVPFGTWYPKRLSPPLACDDKEGCYVTLFGSSSSQRATHKKL